MSKENWIKTLPPRNENENDCDFWKRVYDSMPEDQKQSLPGFIAQIGTWKLIPNQYLWSENYLNEFLEDCEIFKNIKDNK